MFQREKGRKMVFFVQKGQDNVNLIESFNTLLDFFSYIFKMAIFNTRTHTKF